MVARDALGDHHHEPAHDQCKELLRAVVADGLLNLRKSDDIHGHPTAIAGHQAGKLEHLVLGKLAGIGIGEEVNAFQLHAALGDHIAGDGRVDAAGEQHHRPAADARGQAACARLRRAVDIGRMVAHLDINRVFRMPHIHRQRGHGLRNASADFLGNGDGGQGEALVRALGFNLEGRGAAQIVAQIFHRGAENIVQILFAGTAAAQAHNAENVVTGLPRPLQIAGFLLRFDVDRGLHDVHAEFAIRAHPAADVRFQAVFKLEAVAALEDDLALLEKNDVLHIDLTHIVIAPPGHL